jgi:acetyltransferase
MDAVSQIRPFLEPRSIAVIGASPRTGEHSANILDTLAQSGYRGQVYPVNPRHTEILGNRSYPAVTEIPGDVDLGIIMTPRQVVPDIVRECAAKGIRAAVVVGGGFADAAADKEGGRLQAELLEAARKGGVRILGPNTIGAANAFFNFSTSNFRQTDMKERPVGVICQSGLFFGTLGRLSLLGKGLDIGNACDVDAADGLEYFEQDPDIRVIVLHIEGVTDGGRFEEMARRVARKKPVLVLKTGRTERSARAARTHTGSLAGSDTVWDALFKQYGLIRASDINELADLVRAFSYLPLMKGRRIGVVTAMGSVAVMSLDACAEYGLEVPEFSPKVRKGLEAISPAWSQAGNPLDIWPMMMTSQRPLGEILRRIMAEVLSDPGIDGMFLYAGAWFEVFSPSVSEVVIEMADAFPDKPIAWCPYGGWFQDIRAEDMADKLEQAGRAAVFSIPEDALKALAGLAAHREFLNAIS